MTSPDGRPSLNALPPGTVLHDYVIDSELGSGGFSIVYLARHRLNTDWLFAIKEYFPRELVARDGESGNVRPVDECIGGNVEKSGGLRCPGGRHAQPFQYTGNPCRQGTACRNAGERR